MKLVSRLISIIKNLRKKVIEPKLGDWVVSNKNVYGAYHHCKITRIYYRNHEWHSVEKFCQLKFDVAGLGKTFNVPFKSCRLL